ncbi:glycosyltransferase [Myxacorys almedinensis]|uniref:Glycosyltransferase n=1 Tax=Myxacorys almedinensis A TaxID=2690445 RepID=A0A8J8CIJ0_9CYAN|nr:glycosyltransferase [Myxacorys almedinensis]NDJ17883.1 glycosyltransferase [Myxacorys almedinensis A]
MNVVYIITDLFAGGAETMLYKLLSKMNREQFSPVVISLMDRGTWGDYIESLGIPVYTIGMTPGSIPTPAALWRLLRTLHHLEPDLIQGWMYHGNLAAQIAGLALLGKIPVLWNVQNSIYSLTLEKPMTAAVIRASALLSKLPSQIVYVSRLAKSQHEALGYCEKPGCIVPNAADPVQFVPSVAARTSVRAELNLPEHTLLIGLICRFHPMKDHRNFLHAAALLLRDEPDAHFLLVGHEVDLENAVLVQTIQDLGLGDRVHLLGERRDIPRLTAALDIATSASAYGEAFPMILGEAMAAEVPCVATDVGDAGWIVGHTGKIVPPSNPSAIAHAWTEMIGLGAVGRKALGKAARERVLEQFSLDAVVAQYEALYQTVLSQTGAGLDEPRLNQNLQLRG